MTGVDRLLALLSDGEEHTSKELYALGVMVHSRVADLRKRGYRIECRSIPGRTGAEGYAYTLHEPRVPQQKGSVERSATVDLGGWVEPSPPGGNEGHAATAVSVAPTSRTAVREGKARRVNEAVGSVPGSAPAGPLRLFEAA